MNNLNVGAVGETFNYATFFDLSASTGLDLKFTSPAGVKFTISNPRVTAPAVALDSQDTTIGIMAASTYMQFTTLLTDFTESGVYSVCGVYTDATPKVFPGNAAMFTVNAECS